MDADMTIRDVMSREFVGVSESDPVDATVDLMFEEKADCVVVLRGGDPVGLMTERDVLASITESGGFENATVADVMSEAVPSVRSGRDLAVGIDRLATADSSRLVVTENGSHRPVGLLTYRDVATTIAHSLRSGRSSYGASDANARSDRFGDANGKASDADTIQGVCESCGTLSSSLASVDGQLLCGNCRDL
jgi:CBS domain-containing protein